MSPISALDSRLTSSGSAINSALNRLNTSASDPVSDLVSGTTPTAASSATSGTTSLTGSTDPLASESTFLTLLVSQLQNQDPTNPTDSNQFVSQLTSYSQLEQLINIDQNTAPAAAAATTPSTTTGSQNTGTPGV